VYFCICKRDCRPSFKVADRFTKEQRHSIMSSIRGRDTSPEIKVRRYLFSQGFRYRVNVGYLPGKPDVVLRKYSTVIFVNGCFWHGHRGCPRWTEPKTNVEFWRSKVEANRRRDEVVWNALLSMGWKVVVVWECELEGKRRDETLERLKGRLEENLQEKLQEDKDRKEGRGKQGAKAFSRLVKQRKVSLLYDIPESVVKLAGEGDE